MIQRLDPVERWSLYRDRQAERGGELNALLDTRFDAARPEAEAAAERLRAGQPLSAIDGLIMAVKANIAVEGLPWHAGIAAYRDRIAEQDATVVQRLRDAGAVIIGTLNMEEGALGAVTDNPHFGRCYNPWGKGLTPGGSSGGSGAAVAAGLVDASLGTDTMGSVRIPAAYCGVAGHKPSRGRIPTDGVVPLSTTLDHVGSLAPGVSRVAAIEQVLSGCEETLPTWLDGLRIGRWRFEDEVYVDPYILSLFEAALDLMERSGAVIVDLRLPRYDFGAMRRRGLIISEVEGHAEHAAMLETNPDGFSPFFRKMLAYGAGLDEARVKTAFAAVEDCVADAADAFGQCDLLVSPTALETAFEFGEPVPAGQADLTAFADLAGIPATAVPLGVTEDSLLPASIQFMAPAGQDRLCLGAAAGWETLGGPIDLPIR